MYLKKLKQKNDIIEKNIIHILAHLSVKICSGCGLDPSTTFGITKQATALLLGMQLHIDIHSGKVWAIS